MHNLYLKKDKTWLRFAVFQSAPKGNYEGFPTLIYQTDLAASIFSLYAYSSLIKPAPEHVFQVLENSSVAAKSETLSACLCNPKTAVIGLISLWSEKWYHLWVFGFFYLKAKKDKKKK